MYTLRKVRTIRVTREHTLVSGGETNVITTAIQLPQYMVVCASPIRSMVEAGVDVVPGTFTTHEIPMTGAWHIHDLGCVVPRGPPTHPSVGPWGASTLHRTVGGSQRMLGRTLTRGSDLSKKYRAGQYGFRRKKGLKSVVTAVVSSENPVSTSAWL
jgi:hypothetical protein